MRPARRYEVQSQKAGPSTYQRIKCALQAMNKAGQFEAAVLTSIEGLPIITIPTNYDSHVAAALVAMLHKISDRAENQLGMAKIDEVTIYGRDHIRLVCRYVSSQEEKNGLLLAVMVPANRPYRRATNRAIRQIARLLE
jgi:predicted regulator of Ras-like GTPase activity (Roadblock/LC7/MglB family)